MAKQVVQKGAAEAAAEARDGQVSGGDETAAKARAALPEVNDLTAPDDWKAPFYVRWKLHIVAGGVLTVLWFALVLEFIERSFGLSNLDELLPHEVISEQHD